MTPSTLATMAFLTTQATFYFLIMVTLFRLRRRLGIGVFLCALGVMHFLETYLASVFFVELPFGLISPGSTVLFSGKLMMLLLLYIKEDAEAVRQPIYGLLIGNVMLTGLCILLRFMEPARRFAERSPDLRFVDEMGMLMVWGTTLLFIDSILLVLLYEKSARWFGRWTTLRIAFCSAVVLSFDQIFFFAALRLVADVPWAALPGGWVAKLGAAALYAPMLGLYLRFGERQAQPEGGVDNPRMADLFGRLTYRQRYEDLLRRSNTDALTGVLNRGRFEATIGVAHQRPTSLVMLDVDNFKAINDAHGHPTGDAVLRAVAQTLLRSLRGAEQVFRYGGEEFVILCEELSHAEAVALADRLRLAVPVEVAHEVSFPVTVSLGVATSPDDAQDLRSLVKLADARLYEAKRRGRDRVVGRVAA